MACQAQVFKSNNLKYYLIRQLLEKKPADEISRIKNELEN